MIIKYVDLLILIMMKLKYSREKKNILLELLFLMFQAFLLLQINNATGWTMIWFWNTVAAFTSLEEFQPCSSDLLIES